MAKISTTLFGNLALLPYQAQTPATESLAFLTDLILSHNGSEQRFPLRSVPRQTFRFSIPVKLWNIATAFNTSYGAIRDRWALPIWTESQFVGDVIGGTVVIPCNTTLHDLRAKSLALLHNLSGQWRVVEIDSVSDGSISLLSPTPGEVLPSAYVTPIRTAWASGNIDKTTNGFEDVYSIEFEVEDSAVLTPSAPPQFLSQDIYFDETLAAQAITDKSLRKKLNRVDYSLGDVVRRTPWQHTRYASTKRSVLENSHQVRLYREFLYRRSGKYRAFWTPLFEQNMRVINTGVILNDLLIEGDSFNSYAQRPHIAIETSSGVWYARTIANIVPLSGSRFQITVDSPLNISADNLRRVSYLGLHRLDTDTIELRWIGNGVVESEYNVLEISP